MKRLLTVILALCLALLYTLPASAESRGVFGQLDGLVDQDPRLPILDRISELQGASLTLFDGTYVEVSQGLYNEDRVFFSYLIRTSPDRMILHEGAPDKQYRWNQEIENWVVGDTDSFGDPDMEKEAGWLDGKSQRWLECPYYDVHEGILLEDGSFAEILKGESTRLPDGATAGWMECRVPEGKDEMTRTFGLNITCVSTVKFQDFTTFREYWTSYSVFDIPFTLYHYKDKRDLQGASAAETRQARADLSVGRVDLTGTVRLASDEQTAAWTTVLNGGNAGNTDLLLFWELYQDGLRISSGLTGGDPAVENGECVYMLAFPCPDGVTGLTLVPVYARGGEKTAEAIPLETVALQ